MSEQQQTRAPVPYDVEIERAIVGCALVNNAACERALDVIAADDFYDPTCRTIWRAIEQVYRDGGAVDPRIVADVLARQASSRDPVATALDDVGGPSVLFQLEADAPASSRVETFALAAASHAAARRALAVAAEITDAARLADLDTVTALADGALDRIAVPEPAHADTGTELDEMLGDDSEIAYDWLIRDVLERGDRVIVTGGEGAGKSTLLRQIGMQAAIGRHPFTGASGSKLSVVQIDFENSELQSRREWRTLRAIAGDRYDSGRIHVACRPQGIDVTQPRDARWLEAIMAARRPDLVLFGPLYKAHRGSPGVPKHSEEAAEIVSAVIDRLRIRYPAAWLIEAHTTHDAADLRPRGSRLWEGWPEFGLAVKPTKSEREFQLLQWRGPRDATRQWPRILYQGSTWPWTAPEVP